MDEKKGMSAAGRLLLFAVLFTVFQTAGIVLAMSGSGLDLSWVLESVLSAVMCFVLYFAYRSHTKNVMKPLLGAVLMLLLVHAASWGGYYLQNLAALVELRTTDYAFVAYALLQVLVLFVVAGINILHYSINASHHSSPGKVKLNRGLFAAFAVLVLLQCVCYVFLEFAAAVAVGSCLASVADIFALAGVITVEQTMDEFRILREEKAAEASAK